MARSHAFLSTIAIALCTVAATCTNIIQNAVYHTVALFRRCEAVIHEFAAAAVKTVAEKFAAISLIRVPLLQARAFVTRLAKRERPVLTASWRMCPST